jgi:hypothetical protein
MRRIDLEYIEQQLQIENYKLIPGQKYQNAKVKLNCICNKNHEFSITWDKWKRGQRCRKCSLKMIDPEVIKNSLREENYQFIEIAEGGKTNYFYICPNGHRRKLSFSNWQIGHRCLICSNCTKKNIKDVRASFKKEKYTLLEKEYINAIAKMKYKCPKSHINHMSWNKWEQGRRCPTCANIQTGLSKKLDIKYVEMQFSKDDYKLLSKKYINAKQKLLFECPRKHRHYITYDKWKKGQRCKTCQLSEKSSQGERMIEKTITNLIYLREYKIPECKNIKPLPFDFAIFDSNKTLKALIEFNGEQHYRPVRRFGGKKAFVNQTARDKIKIEYCSSNNIPLLIIKFDQKDSINEIIESFLKTIP